MHKTDLKAMRFVTDGNVELLEYTVDGDGAILTADGWVTSERNVYRTTITPEGTTCTCVYGAAHGTTLQSHSHDTALRLAARLQEQNDGE